MLETLHLTTNEFVVLVLLKLLHKEFHKGDVLITQKVYMFKYNHKTSISFFEELICLKKQLK